MPRATSDTRGEIRAAALDLFAERGFDATSLREIAERIGITKAALYYHYASKDALLTDLVDPLFADLADLATALEVDDVVLTRDVLERYWDLCRRHRPVMRVLIHNATVVSRADVGTRMLHWRERIDTVLAGAWPHDRVRAVIALGGLQDAVVVFEETDLPVVRETAIDAAQRAITDPSSPG